MGNHRIILWNIVFWTACRVGFYKGTLKCLVVSASSRSVSSNLPNSLVATSDICNSSKSILIASSKFNCKDEDFFLPQLKFPRTNRHISTKSSQLVDISMDSSNTLLIVSVLVFSLSKILYHFTTVKEMVKEKCKELRVEQLLRKLPTGINCFGIRESEIQTTQNSPNAFALKSKGSPRTDEILGNKDSFQDILEERYKSLAVENTSLQEQTTSLDRPADNMNLQTLRETVEYWKRVAKMNEQQTINAIQMERKSSKHHLEQLKADMVQLVEQERSVLLEEFHSMVVQLRESLIEGTQS